MVSTMVTFPDVTCIVYAREINSKYYYDVYRITGEIVDTLDKGIDYIETLKNDARYTDLYLLMTTKSMHLDQVIEDIADIMEHEPVLRISDMKEIKDYDSELSELINLSGVINLGKRTNNLITDYKKIVDSYNNSMAIPDKELILGEKDFCALDDLLKVINKIDINVYDAMNYITKKRNTDYNKILKFLYEKTGMTLDEYCNLLKDNPIKFSEILKKLKINGSIETKKKVFKRTLKIWKK